MSNTKFSTDSIIVCHFASANMKEWNYVRTIFSEPKFLGSRDYHTFLRMVLRYARLARECCAMKLDVLNKNFLKKKNFLIYALIGTTSMNCLLMPL